MKKYGFVFFLIIAVSCKKTSNDSRLNARIDTVVKDSLSNISPQGLNKGLENSGNKNDIHEILKNDFQIDNLELEELTKQYRNLRETYSDSVLAPVDSYKDLINKWVPLDYHDNRYNVYLYCEFQKRWELTDSSLIRYYTDGPVVELLLSVKRTDDEIDVKTTRSTVHFKLIDKENLIYSTDDGYEAYITPLTNAGKFPVMYQECD